MFQSSLIFLCEFREYAKSVVSSLENTPKVFNGFRRMRQKSLSVHGDYDDFTVVLFIQRHLRIQKKNFSVQEGKNTLKEYKRIRE